MKACPSNFPGKLTQVETKNLRVRAPVLEYTKARLFQKRLLLTF